MTSEQDEKWHDTNEQEMPATRYVECNKLSSRTRYVLVAQPFSWKYSYKERPATVFKNFKPILPFMYQTVN